MASRTRKYMVRYGGWKAGTLNSVVKTEPAYVGTHLCVDETHPGPPYTDGGPLLVTKKKVFLDRTDDYSARYGIAPVQDWSGHLSVLAYVPSPEPTPMSLAGWGAKGWNRTFPTHPIYNLGVSLIELKDFPHMIRQTWDFFRRMRGNPFSGVPRTIGEALGWIGSGAKNTAGDYLNYQFGWAPFLQDLNFILQMQKKLAQKLAWLRRHNRKSIRRKVTLDAGGFSENVSRVTQPFTTMSPVLPTQLYSGSVVSTASIPIRKEYDSKIWFSAKYRFYIPELDGQDLRALKLSLLGIDLDPSIIYKVIPWSWLLDWFLNIGTVIQNIYLRARYHVVAEYAYVMGSEKFRYIAPGYTDVNTGVYGWNGRAFVWSGLPRRLSGESQTIYEFRQREVANPYGFGITFSSLSSYQWSILAALGLSRRKSHSAPRS